VKEPKKGKTALALAADNGHTAIAQALLAKGARAQEKDLEGSTVLIAAVEKGHAATVQALLDKGGDVRTKDENGVPLLLMAADRGHAETVRSCSLKAPMCILKTRMAILS
jgi:ankyrin repeat protein